MRGALRCPLRSGIMGRFIPAHAGSTSRANATSASSAVHPRACGEHSRPTVLRSRYGGSSPRMRGAPLHVHRCARHTRFIPAHAGSTHEYNKRKEGIPVHPRACGEHIMSPESKIGLSGSSPRMRGAHFHASTSRRLTRFIPAHAGSTYTAAFPKPCAPVHPRACGEHLTSESRSPM